MDELIKYTTSHWGEIIGIAILSITVIGVTLGFTKKAIFYNDFNDLGISAATFAVPALIVVGVGAFIPHESIMYFAAFAFFGFFAAMVYKTFLANNKSIILTGVLVVAKMTMSFLYVLHLYTALTGKKRSERGQGWFVLAIMTPLLLALVHTKEGSFRLAPSGRPRFF